MKKGILIFWIIIICFTISACSKKNESHMTADTQIEEKESVISDILQEQSDWVSNLKVANKTNQILVVAADGNKAEISLHSRKQNGVWEEIISADATIGKNGVGKAQEGDGKTPSGEYHFMFGFGIKENPGTSFEYVQVDDSYYWIDDSQSQYYNQFVSTKDVLKDWDSAEHIISAEESYHYVLALDYNIECMPGKGSAIFMHCMPTGGAGCIAVSEEIMIEVMQKVQKDCVVIIDDKDNIHNY